MQLHDHKAKMIKNTIDQQHIFDINIENILLHQTWYILSP